MASSALADRYGVSGYNPITGVKAPLANPVGANDPTGNAAAAAAAMAAKKAALDSAAANYKGPAIDPNATMNLNPEKNVQTGENIVTSNPNKTSNPNNDSALSKWSLEGDPLYQQAMRSGQSAFNSAKANAMLKMQAQQNALTSQILAMDQNAPDANRALADSFAVRGMQRGDYGAYYRAQDKQNAALITAQTDIKDQIASLNQDFLSNYGTAGADWLGTAQGQDARTKAIQLALQNRLAQAGVNG